ncbi:hypothetical protein PPYR_01112 [Photinus pyralis]|uniref:Luciferin 4-monooxygenase n=1 Tax=Photinus pyralis TaxID=7054 RepID=A0A1Y1N4Y8_PHOPY|nr:4-coumarate--CoA ligase 1-like [Photinus pyralis]KAB0804142.1 hypothetical protein PPYR_01112 [Photinus pyralis]
MATNNSCIISGPKEKFKIWFESLGIYLYNCLKDRKADDVLVIDADSKIQLTCGDALSKSVKLCKFLKSIPLRKGDVVGIVSENLPNTYVALLGALLAGTTVLLLNPSYTRRELVHALGIAKPSVILSSLTAIPNLLQVKNTSSLTFDIITIDGSWDKNNSRLPSIDYLIENLSEDFEIDKVEIQDIAFLLLSSGTTGLPKCVKISNQNMILGVNTINDSRYLNVGPDDVVISILPFFHVYGLYIHLTPIVASTKVILMKKFKPDLFLQSIQDYRVTKLITVPPIVHFLLKSPAVSNYDVSSINDMPVGAAPLGQDIYEEFLKRFPHVSIRQLYGLTETSGICTIQQSTGGGADVGTPLCNSQCKVIDLCSEKPVKALHVGELCIKGIGVSSGYYKGKTEADVPIADDDGFYHTGDLGYYDEAGKLFIVDRLKEIIKYKCYQVSPSELEDVLLSHPAVRDCGVIGIPDERAGELPLAFVVRQDDTNITEQELVEFVAENLSIHKHLYGGVRFIEEIPRTISGKILRKELKKICY